MPPSVIITGMICLTIVALALIGSKDDDKDKNKK